MTSTPFPAEPSITEPAAPTDRMVRLPVHCTLTAEELTHSSITLSGFAAEAIDSFLVRFHKLCKYLIVNEYFVEKISGANLAKIPQKRTINLDKSVLSFACLL